MGRNLLVDYWLLSLRFIERVSQMIRKLLVIPLESSSSRILPICITGKEITGLESHRADVSVSRMRTKCVDFTTSTEITEYVQKQTIVLFLFQFKADVYKTRFIHCNTKKHISTLTLPHTKTHTQICLC